MDDIQNTLITSLDISPGPFFNVSASSFVPSFNPRVVNYTLTLDATVDFFRIRYSPVSSVYAGYVVLHVNDQPVEDLPFQLESAAYPLLPGVNAVQMILRSKDMFTARVYTLGVRKGDPPSPPPPPPPPT